MLINLKEEKLWLSPVGKEKASKLFWIFPLISYIAIVIGVSTNLFPLFTLISFFSIPLMFKSGFGLQKNYDSIDRLVPYMSSTLMFGRITGVLFVIGFLIGL